MNCTTAEELMSAFHDQEVSADLQSALWQHLESCSRCWQTFNSYRELSQLASQLPEPTPPANLWTEIERELDDAPPQLTSSRLRWKTPMTKLIALAAVVLVMVGGGLFIPEIWLHDAQHDQFAADFDHYLNQFRVDPNRAQRVLMENYDGRAVDVHEATTLVRYQPAAGQQVPAGYSLHAVNVLKMPCCTCVEVIWKRDAGGYVAVFEHEKEQTVWFGNRPSISAHCKSIPMQIVQIDQMLAATWDSGPRQLTLIGAQDIEELHRLVSHFGDTS